MNNFEFANKFTSKWEGGFVDHKSDPGGATNYGVSLRWLKNEGIDIDGDGKIDINDIKALTPGKAAELFKKEFWNKLKCEQLDKLVACVTYDAGVNVGRTQAVKFLQRACNRVTGSNLVVDGIIGTATISSTNNTLKTIELAIACIEARESFHKELANKSPYPDGRDYRPFIKGWLNRTSDLKMYIYSK